MGTLSIIIHIYFLYTYSTEFLLTLQQDHGKGKAMSLKHRNWNLDLHVNTMLKKNRLQQINKFCAKIRPRMSDKDL